MRLPLLLAMAALPACSGGDSTGCERDPQDYCLQGLAVESPDGTRISGELRWREADVPLVLLVHQLGSTRAEWNDLREALQSRGSFAFASFDLRGHGESRQRGEETIAWQDFDQAEWDRLPEDTGLVLDAARAERNPPDAVLVGSSIGSSAVLLHAASATASASAVAMISPGLAYRNLDTTAPMADWGSRPVLLLATTGDLPSAEAVADLSAIATDETSIVYTGSDAHGVSIADDIPSFLDDVASWIDAAVPAN